MLEEAKETVCKFVPPRSWDFCPGHVPVVRMLHPGDVHGVVQGDEVRLVVDVHDGGLDVTDMLAL